jgi:hypothetical protein
MLSIGTAAPGGAKASEAIRPRGYLGWARELVALTLDAQETLAVEQAGALLKRNFLRIDAAPAPGQAPVLALDRATPAATATLRLLGENAAAAVKPADLAFLALPRTASS